MLNTKATYEAANYLPEIQPETPIPRQDGRFSTTPVNRPINANYQIWPIPKRKQNDTDDTKANSITEVKNLEARFTFVNVPSYPKR